MGLRGRVTVASTGEDEVILDVEKLAAVRGLRATLEMVVVASY